MTIGEAEYIVRMLDLYFRNGDYEKARIALTDAPRWLRNAVADFEHSKCGSEPREETR